MMLIGQYDSPFVRRVAVTLKMYGLDYEHAAWSTFGDAEKIAAFNPLMRVPTLVLDDGLAVMDSAVILAVLDDMVGGERATLSRSGSDRRTLLRLCALAGGAAEKGVSLVYERNMRENQLDHWVYRCVRQIGGALAQIEQERAARPSLWLFDEAPSHADILLGTMVRFLAEAVSYDLGLAKYPALDAHAAACERLPEFQATYAPFLLAPACDPAA